MFVWLHLLSWAEQVGAECLVPVWVVGLALGAGPLHVQLVHVDGNVGVELGGLAAVLVQVVPGHELGGLQVRRGADRHLTQHNVREISLTKH